MKGFSKISTILLIAIVVIGGGYYALITYYFGGTGEDDVSNYSNGIVKNAYGFEYKADFRLDEFTVDFNSLLKTVKEVCDEEGLIIKEDYCTWSPRDFSQEDLINWKQWIEKGILNHPDRYTKYTILDAGTVGIALIEDDVVEEIDIAKTPDRLGIFEEKIIDIGGKKALKRIYHSPQALVAMLELVIFADNGDLIILNDDFDIWKGLASNGRDLGELSKEEIKNHPQNILFDEIISTFKFTK